MSLNPSCEVEEDGLTWALVKGTGTNDDEKGVAPEEKGTLGLLVPLRTLEPLPNAVVKEPAKIRLDCDALAVIECTSPPAPDNPPNGAADQDDALVSQTATEGDGVVNCPPTQSVFCEASQKTAAMSPFGPFEPKEENEFDE